MFSSVGMAAANPSQVAENMPSSIVGMASALPGGARDHKPKYGMSMRFKVRVDSLGDLGHWSSCQGLRVDFKPIEVKSGGAYTSSHWLPGEVAYPKVVLKRAVDSESSRVVQQWLKKAALGWIDGTNTNSAPPSAKVVLLNAEDQPVLTWTLKDVRPAGWSGPDLDSSSSKVAIETLELVHGGFEVEVHGAKSVPPPPPRPPGPGDTVPKLKLTNTLTNDPIEFDHKPVTITLDRNTQGGAVRTGEGGELETTRPNITALSLSKLTIDGPRTMENVEKLVAWATPRRSVALIGRQRATAGQNTAPEDLLPRLKLEWGTFKYEVNLNRINATYTRFHNGTPVRADVQLTLKVLKKIADSGAPTPPQNPTSGGIPGRSAHTMVLGENLPLLAENHYGNPSRWREIAEANGIDDPLRVRPGARVYLPAPTELVGRR